MCKVLLTADWHIRGDRPRCRTDEDWLESQRRDIRNVAAVAREKGCAFAFILGDLFHQARVSTEAVNMALAELKALEEGLEKTSFGEPGRVFILPGNHDLPYHDYGNLEQSSLGIVLKMFRELHTPTPEDPWRSACYSRIYAMPFGMDEPGNPEHVEGRSVWATHQLTFPDRASIPPGAVGRTAQELVDAAPWARIIMTGDYHHGYLDTYERADGSKCRVVTPGCLNIQAADMAEYRPRVYVWDVDTDAIERVYLPVDTEHVRTDYLEAEEEREDRMEEFAGMVGTAAGVSLSFRDNLAKALDGMEPPDATPGDFSGPDEYLDAVKGKVLEIVDKLTRDRA